MTKTGEGLHVNSFATIDMCCAGGFLDDPKLVSVRPEGPELAAHFVYRTEGFKSIDRDLMNRGAGTTRLRSVTTTVVFRDLGAEEIDAYVATGEPLDKAGGYGIQGGAREFVSKIDGPWDNVVGLPMDTVREMLGS